MKTNDTNKKIKNFIPLLFLILILVSPALVSAQSIIPCGGYIYDANGNKTGDQPPCDFNYLMELVNNVIDWIIKISVPVAAGVFAWAGIKYMTTGVSDQKAAAKAMIQKVFIGFVFILAAWIIVGTITKALLKDPSIVPVDLTIKNSINFYI